MPSFVQKIKNVFFQSDTYSFEKDTTGGYRNSKKIKRKVNLVILLKKKIVIDP